MINLKFSIKDPESFLEKIDDLNEKQLFLGFNLHGNPVFSGENLNTLFMSLMGSGKSYKMQISLSAFSKEETEFILERVSKELITESLTFTNDEFTKL